MNKQAGIQIAAFALMTLSMIYYIISMSFVSESKFAYYLSYFTQIVAFILVDCASVIQTLYWNHQMNKVFRR